MEDCVFCKIAKGEIDSAKIWENEKFVAILDINPNTKGMAVVITKDHYNSYIFDMSDDIYTEFMLAAKKVSKILERGLNVERVVMVMEGMEINHAHIKLFPLYGVKGEFKEMCPKQDIFFKEYQGYISTLSGPKKDLQELKILADQIKKKNSDALN